MERNYNFCAGPSMLPTEVLTQVQSELLSWNGMGASVMELSHRSKEFESIIKNCETNLRHLINIPDNYHVLFLQGGAYTHFSVIPWNLLGTKTSIDVINTGIWSKKAASAMQKYAHINVVASTESENFRTLPDKTSLEFSKESAFVHYCDNETINGVEFSYQFEAPIPIVADMSSNILSRKIDVSKLGLIYAGAQKNIGPAGVTVIIVKDELLYLLSDRVPDIFDYKKQSQNLSMINTPPTFSIYIMDLVLKYLIDLGGVEKQEEINRKKSEMLYKCIDSSALYENPIEINARSRMNVPFILKEQGLEEKFLSDARNQGLINLEGHRSVGGMRASIYNAMPLSGVEALCEFMNNFEKSYG